MKRRILIESLRYGWHSFISRKAFIACLMVLPLAFTFFFISLMNEGVATKVPSGVVDLDQSSMSRKAIRSLNASELVDVNKQFESFHEAIIHVRRGDIYGFFMIPADYQKDALSNRQPTISYYCNMSYFIPGTLIFKGFKTTAVTTAGGLALTTLVDMGMTNNAANDMIQPVAFQQQAIGNPWMNYNYYLTNSFIPGIIALFVMLITAYSICGEIKHGTSKKWLHHSGGSIFIALLGKLTPQTIIATCIGIICQTIMYGFCNFPLNCPIWHMILAMALLVIASQAFAVIICGILPNLRFAISACSLFGILAFSLAAFSFPVEAMYPSVGIFSYILPVRYYFLIYIDQALNGIPLYFSRFYYVALCIFPLVSLLWLPRLKKHLSNPIYLP